MTDACYSCGGTIKLVQGPGRFHCYRGVRVEFPPDLPIRTCQACGAQWMNGNEIAVLSESFETQRLAYRP
jgi:hypothetical protein